MGELQVFWGAAPQKWGEREVPAESRAYHGATPTGKITAFRASETAILQANEPGHPL